LPVLTLCLVSIRAPRTRAGRLGSSVICSAGALFQSAPRAPARGDKPPWAAGASSSQFQSAPRAPARGDRKFSAPWATSSCFNPRPAHPRGATRRWTLKAQSMIVSIRAPRTRAGRLLAEQRAGRG